MNRSELTRIFRNIVLGVSAPLIGACESPPRFDPVIPSLTAASDSGTPTFDSGVFDSGVLSGYDFSDGSKLQCALQYYYLTDGGAYQWDGGSFPMDFCADACDAGVSPVIDLLDGGVRGFMYANGFKGCQNFERSLVCWSAAQPVPCGVGGRLASGVECSARGTGLARVFADMASHESAAVIAFDQLAEEFAHHGLSPGLQRAARRAAAEERRHVRLVGALARGASFSLTRTRPQVVRSLEDIARDNAVEGCGRETFGSLIGLYQAKHAKNRRVRRVMAQVTADEIGHAQWSRAAAEQLSSRIRPAVRRELRDLRDEALTQMAAEFANTVPAELHDDLGIPDAERLQTMATELRAALST
jgi:hypothetical protein